MESGEIKVEIIEFNEDNSCPRQSFHNSSPGTGNDAVNELKTQDIKKENNMECQSGSENEIHYQEGDKKPAEKRRRGGRPKKSDFEKKLNQIERARRFRAKNVNIGDQVERWAYLKCMTNMDTNTDLAKLLIDFYIEHHPSLAMMPEHPLNLSGQEDPHIAETEEDIQHSNIENNEISNAHMCRYCGQCFKQRRNLHTHEKSHTNTLPFTCCDIGFASRREMQRHREAELRLGSCEIKVEVTEEGISDTVYDNSDSLSMVPDLNVYSNGGEVKVEPDDPEYDKALSTNNTEPSKYCNHGDTANNESSNNVPKVKSSQEQNHKPEKKRTGSSKRKGLSDAISYLKVKKLKEIQ